MNNRLHNCKNPYQGSAKKVLAICSAGLLRSPTAAIVLQREYGYNTRAAGIDTGHALIPVDDVLIAWADEIVCMEVRQQMSIAARDIARDTPVYALEVPDMFAYMDEKLQDAILNSYKEVLRFNKDNPQV